MQEHFVLPPASPGFSSVFHDRW